jgi:hypothetical protein
MLAGSQRASLARCAGCLSGDDSAQGRRRIAVHQFMSSKFFQSSESVSVSGRYSLAFQRPARELGLSAEQAANLERAPATQQSRVVCCATPKPVAPSNETWFIR